MSCPPFDLKDYFLKELLSPQRLQVEDHVRQCVNCRQELERLQITEAALFSLRDEEIPQRIAFVSDKIFEPSPVRRWFAGFWGSAARLGFASAALLSGAIFYDAIRPRPITDRAMVISTVAADVSKGDPGKAELSKAEIQQQIHQAVAQAVADVEARQARKNTQMVSLLERRADEIGRSLLLTAGQTRLDLNRRQMNLRASMKSPSDGEEQK